MARDILLHIGRAKTGTSSIQEVLANSEAALAAHGWRYASAARRGSSHRYAAVYFSNQKRLAFDPAVLQQQVDALAAELASTDQNTIISGEGFQNAARPEKIAPVIPPERTQVLVYLREQYVWAQSTYAQKVKATEYNEDFETYLQTADPRYEVMLQRWRRGFNPAQLTARLYDRACLAGGDVIDDFLGVIGLDRTGMAPSQGDKNPSIGGPLLELKRRLNTVPGFASLRAVPRIYRAWLDLAASDPRMRQRPWAPTPVVEAYRSRFVDSNSRVDQDLLGAEAGLSAAARRARDLVVAAPDVADVGSAWDALASLRPEAAESIRAVVEAAAKDGHAEALGLSQIVLR
ncbi:hypothetical protein ASG17_13260 [Brevundimonas sp. Leaf363]|uniref:hypothetical protein n=1 Tax=Brevundimonas sp. Leaf363 TaxID=1736353 RepID=UPI0006FD55D7|nr:hypothetical protein [Brevundimonas sp. Leaf363]KQS53919.1 hypothetical protein ASG17_13260 [Brevundimonas sp. Leaf363]